MRGAFDINSSADEDDDSRKESPLPHQVHTALTSPGDGLVEALRVSDIRLVRSDEDGATRLPLEIYEALTALDDGLVETLRAGDIRLVSAEWFLAQPDGYRIQRRQDLEVLPSALLTPDAAVKLVRQGNRGAGSLTYGCALRDSKLRGTQRPA